LITVILFEDDAVTFTLIL